MLLLLLVCAYKRSLPSEYLTYRAFVIGTSRIAMMRHPKNTVRTAERRRVIDIEKNSNTKNSNPEDIGLRTVNNEDISRCELSLSQLGWSEEKVNNQTK